MSYAHEVVSEVAGESLRRFGELLNAGQVITHQPWRGSEPWTLAKRKQYRREHGDVPLPAFSDGLARPEQLEPGSPGASDASTDWAVWYLQGGRGSGKTRPAAETLATWMQAEAGEYAIVAPTYGAARDTCIEGPSGLIRALGGTSTANLGSLIRERNGWNRSIGELYLRNGSTVRIDGADDGALRVQGKNLRGAWVDEVGLWRRRAKAGGQEREPWYIAWVESLGFAVRIGAARIIATGTPKQGHPLVKLLINDEATVVTRLRTTDNAANLAPAALQRLIDLYHDTRIGRQELGGELLEDVEGALWTLAQIEADRMSLDEFLATAVRLLRAVTGVDPSGGVTETGIVKMAIGDCPGDRFLCGGCGQQHGYIFEDATSEGSPDTWGRAVVACHNNAPEGDRVVAEVNQGGKMVRFTLATVDANLPIREVSASKGKQARAEPVSALAEQHRLHHVGAYPKLEDELTQWVPNSGMESPNRLDAYVWAATDLFFSKRQRSEAKPLSLTRSSTWMR